MSALYFDATYLCKLHFPEPSSAEVKACAVSADKIVCGLHGRAEFYSAGYRKVREGAATTQALQIILPSLTRTALPATFDCCH